MTRTVQARQRGKCIFTATASFMREGSGGEKVVEHECGMPEGVKEGLEEALNEEEDEESIRQKEANGEDSSGPFVSKRLRILNSTFILSTCILLFLYLSSISHTETCPY